MVESHLLAHSHSLTHLFFNFHFMNAWNDSLTLVSLGGFGNLKLLTLYAFAPLRFSIGEIDFFRKFTDCRCLGKTNERANDEWFTCHAHWMVCGDGTMPYTNEHTNDWRGSLRLSVFVPNERTPCAELISQKMWENEQVRCWDIDQCFF